MGVCVCVLKQRSGMNTIKMHRRSRKATRVRRSDPAASAEFNRWFCHHKKSVKKWSWNPVNGSLVTERLSGKYCSCFYTTERAGLWIFIAHFITSNISQKRRVKHQQAELKFISKHIVYSLGLSLKLQSGRCSLSIFVKKKKTVSPKLDRQEENRPLTDGSLLLASPGSPEAWEKSEPRFSSRFYPNVLRDIQSASDMFPQNKSTKYNISTATASLQAETWD